MATNRPTRKKFGSSRAHGLQVEQRFRRKYPLTDNARAELLERITDIVSKNRKHYSRFFVSLEMSVLGGLYQVKFGFAKDDDEDTKWEQQWVSTPVVKRIADLKSETNELLDEGIDFQVAERPARLLAFRVVFISNKRK